MVATHAILNYAVHVHVRSVGTNEVTQGVRHRDGALAPGSASLSTQLQRATLSPSDTSRMSGALQYRKMSLASSSLTSYSLASFLQSSAEGSPLTTPGQQSHVIILVRRRQYGVVETY